MIYLFFAAICIFLGTVARSMPELGLLYMLVYLPMNMLNPAGEHALMGCDLDAGLAINPFRTVRAFDPLPWRRHRCGLTQFLAVAVVGGQFFGFAILRFRSVAAQST